ncbi:hypothetical protein [Streptomyces sp. NPDC059994]|uniref:hypothetical protein n=1 Tax=Streptomyces sp. NPDC059994 TaxID=3347029 RepID=UPI0036BEB652
MRARATLAALAAVSALLLTGCTDNTDCDGAGTPAPIGQAAPAAMTTSKPKPVKPAKPKAVKPKTKPTPVKTVHHDHDDCEDDD